MGHSIHNVDISKPLTHTTPSTLSAICPVQWKPGFIREENTSPKCQTPSNVSICPLKSVTTTNCSQVETPMRMTSMQMSFPETVSDSLCRNSAAAPAAVAEEVSAISISVADVTRSFKRVNIHKAVGPDGIPGHVLRACAFQLAGVFTDIFNLSLSLSVVPLCFKKSTIVPIPKKNKITCLNDWRPVALTPIFSKCFEKLIRDYICSVLPASMDPLQFAYHSNRSTDNAIAFTLHTALSHMENKNAYVRMLFVDYSSAFSTIVPATLVAKLQTLGLNRSLCSWILDFLTGRSQVVRMGNNTSSPLTLNTGAPQGCVLSPLLTVWHSQIRWRHNGDRPDHWQRWDGLQSGGEYPD